jgi:hypothetical protein
MRKLVRRPSQRQVLGYEHLESRTALAISILAIDNGFDFVGSDSSVGPDGYNDSRILLNGLATDDVTSVRVEAMSGSTVVYTWAYGAGKKWGHSTFRLTDTGEEMGTFYFSVD